MPKECGCAEDQNVFTGTDSNIRERFRGAVDHETRAGLQTVGSKTHRAAEQSNCDLEYRVCGSERSYRQECASERANYGMDGVPNRIDPRDLIGKKFQGEKDAGKDEDDRISKNRKRSELWSEVNPP